jgi:hypothetical protein
MPRGGATTAGKIEFFIALRVVMPRGGATTAGKIEFFIAVRARIGTCTCGTKIMRRAIHETIE